MAMTHGIARGSEDRNIPWPWYVCEYVPVDADRRTRLRGLARAYKRADEKAEAARRALAAEVLSALDEGEQQVEIVGVIGFSREWVRRQVVRERRERENTAS